MGQAIARYFKSSSVSFVAAKKIQHLSIKNVTGTVLSGRLRFRDLWLGRIENPELPNQFWNSTKQLPILLTKVPDTFLCLV